MLDSGKGMTRVPTADLVMLLRRVHRKDIPIPFQRTHLLTLGFNSLADYASDLCGLDERALRVLLVAVIAERRVRKISQRS